MILWICVILIFPFVLILFPTKIYGKKYLKKVKKQATIFASNHQTNNDVIILKCRICPNSKIMAKNSLFKNKVGGFFLRKFGGYPVDRGGNDISAIKTTLKILKSKKQILLFPEGTRMKNAEEISVKNGLSLFAIKTDSYVVPMCFRKITMPFVFNKLMIGKPFKFSEYPELAGGKTDKESLETASKILEEKMQYLRTVSIKEYKLEYKEYKRSLKK